MEVKNINIAFFNLGPWEILLILIVILILFGARRLPELARGLGQGINEFRDAVDSSKKEIIDGIETDAGDNLEKDSEE
ncbi:MAG: twin-arginine translocase TatA/TatE family subunit [Candidatus Marinimicrobia bacterium]|jgi:sec-independent protein translocase protein TatA|nr:twin-arginine translocase TatA/TatE family subunit [Candidatus Neomarinimicrobiota bacterium]MEC7850352.1 twin-arginine translocase TatA/TatE family subunit [Candidatus Neomarinimicrobiota bacterium]|tara:strand:+ start:15201 stop:15434 length:234 start_codon:yes stop_codon:yes gene_type:complete